MATGEVVDAESLGGADMHSRVSGLSDQLAIDEYDAIRKARDWIANLNWEQKGKLPPRHLAGQYEEPYYSAGKEVETSCVGHSNETCDILFILEELLGIVSANIRIPFDATEVIIRLVDGSRFTPFKPNYGGNLVCGWAFIHGMCVSSLL
jgi:acetyl-CoA carboxylase carboxyltransferase component